MDQERARRREEARYRFREDISVLREFVQQGEFGKVEFLALVARKGDQFYVADSFFRYPTGAQGVTGMVIRPLGPEEVAALLDPFSPGALERMRGPWRAAVAEGRTFKDLADWVAERVREEGLRALMDIAPFNYAALIGVEWAEVVGEGLVFSTGEDFDEVYSPELLSLIREIES